ncbi:MAG: desulfoferrodoxin FeS4 iron-binding domain-containing protein [Candidatus Gastranaerophilales bacterium]|nr:desulfoferrodoxin FeS4 iron-binding domain-containing protein [Candidatus Gastranaerophilales bacterium]
MTELNELYRCKICGNIVEVVGSGFGELVCCGKPMEKIEAAKEETMYEKHLPVLVKTENDKYLIRVGSVEHPMTEEHYIMFIEAVSKDGKYLKRVFLNPKEKPELDLECVCRHFKAREFCNIHGLYEAELSKEKAD